MNAELLVSVQTSDKKVQVIAQSKWNLHVLAPSKRIFSHTDINVHCRNSNLE